MATPTVFTQVLSLGHHETFHRCVERYRGDACIKSFSCYDQWLAMAFAQLTARESLRDLEAALGARRALLYQMGLCGRVVRSTLADANERRDWRTYSRRCAITGERTLPALEAGHIQPYSKSGPHDIRNGLLLRSDLHNLFDLGYLTVTFDYRVEVSRRIREEFENGRDYYALHGRTLSALPTNEPDRPGKEFLEWHHGIFKG